MAEVLAKVQKEVGADAQISSAQRVRSGGVMGFFQKERFEVLVDVPEPGEIIMDQAPTSLIDLADRVSAAEKGGPAPKAVTPRRGGRGRAAAAYQEPTPAAHEGAASSMSSHVETPSPLSDPAPASHDDIGSVRPRTTESHDRPEIIDDEPVISTETERFAEILSRMAFQADMRSSTERPSIPTDVVDDEDDETNPIVEDHPTVVAKRSGPAAQAPLIEDRPPSLGAPRPTTAPVQRDDRPDRAPEPARADQVPAHRTRITDHPLFALGLPTSYIPADVERQQLQKALAASLERLPKVPSIRPSKGCIIAVVGDRSEAINLANDLARKWGRADEEVVLVSRDYRGKEANKILRTVRSAEESRRSWSRRAKPTIVAVEARPGSRDATWAEHMLTALEPMATYGVTDATRKAEDIAAWAVALGGIDCLAINRIDETVSPAAVLAAGIPVERIDGRKATPAYWATILMERLNAA